MERRLANRIPWKRVLERDFDVVRIDSPVFTGYLTRLLLHTVTEPLHKTVLGYRYCVADSGYCWLQHFPEGAHHTVTTMVDATGAVVQWYIDICADQGVTADGIPWLDDLYLDIVVLPSRATVLLDADELEAALKAGTITETQYDLAWREADTLLRDIKRGSKSILDLTVEHHHEYFAS